MISLLLGALGVDDDTTPIHDEGSLYYNAVHSCTVYIMLSYVTCLNLNLHLY